MDQREVCRTHFSIWVTRVRARAQSTRLFANDPAYNPVFVPVEEAVACFVKLRPKCEPYQQELVAYAHKLVTFDDPPRFDFDKDEWESEKAKAEQIVDAKRRPADS
ncbi:hypothetical protein ACFL09_00300 [Planctomycetota bacterium]